MIICPPMQSPAINGTTVYAEQLKRYFNAQVLSTNALDFIAFHSSNGKTHDQGSPITYLKSLNDTATLSTLRHSTNGLLNSFINGPISKDLLVDLIKSDESLIYSLTLPFLNNYYTLWASRLSGKKCVISPFYIEGIVHSSHKRLLSKFDLVLACTEHEKNCIGGINVQVSPMSVNPAPFMKADGSRFREKYGLEGLIVLFVGHANYEKGAYNILKACDEVKASFVFMGPHTRGFKQRVKRYGNVKLINPQLKNKYDAFKACDVYCMPSRVEAFGITYLEAWACKKPVVAADTPVSREVISDCGLFVDFDQNPAEAIKESLKRPDLGQKGRERLMKYFTEEKVMKKLKKELSSIIE